MFLPEEERAGSVRLERERGRERETGLRDEREAVIVEVPKP